MSKPGAIGTSRPWWVVALAVLVTFTAFGVGLGRLRIVTDITSVLPGTDRIVADARYILASHPGLDKVFIDLSLTAEDPDPELLASAAKELEAELERSGLFSSVGLDRAWNAFPLLISTITHHLPLFFNQAMLLDQVEPRLSRERIDQALVANLAELGSISSLGQAELMGADPLRLREVVLTRLLQTLTRSNNRLYRGQIMSPDERHLLIIADPVGAGTDTAFGRRLAALLDDLAGRARARFPGLAVTPVGSYRASLDNERIIRRDATRAGLVATLGIALLLFLSFPRGLIGLAALLPALAGGLTAVGVYSLLRTDISALSLGFGGALISISVDHAIAFLMFLDRTKPTTGREAARSVRSVGIYTTLTTVGAFLVMMLSGFPLLEEVGLFAALGVALSFLFVHLVFPATFGAMPAAGRPARLPLDRILVRLTRLKTRAPLVLVSGFGLIMAFWSRPVFEVDLKAMNTVTPATQRAEALVERTWGESWGKIHLFIEAKGPEELLARSDALSGFLEGEVSSGAIKQAPAPGLVWPGPRQAQANLKAWLDFWTEERKEKLWAHLEPAAQGHGYSPGAFEGFRKALEQPALAPLKIPPALLPLFGILPNRQGDGLVQLSGVVPGPAFEAEAFHQRAAQYDLRVLDEDLFTARLGDLLASAFILMLALVALAVVVLLTFLFLDWILILSALAPLGLALVGTLGLMKLLGHNLDIPGLMLSVVVLGVGVDYGLFFVRAYQRFGADDRMALGSVCGAVGLAAGSTLLGMISLLQADHSVLRSAGTVSFLGIGLCSIGAFTILPPILNRLFRAPGAAAASLSPDKAVLARFRHLEPHPRLFARFKLALDPMFPRLGDLIVPGRILDVGCGYGVPACWLAARHPEAEILAMDPNRSRARTAGRVLGRQGWAVVGRAPDLPDSWDRVDTALMLDMAHYLDRDQLLMTLGRIRQKLGPGGRLVLRVTIPQKDGTPWLRRIEEIKAGLSGRRIHWRTSGEIQELLKAAGLRLVLTEPTRRGREETWFAAEVEGGVGR